MHVINIISDHGPLWRNFPIVGHFDDSIVLFGDHRNSIVERAETLARYLPLSEITSVERVVFDPVEPDCVNGIHSWEPMSHDGRTMTGGRCSACGLIEELPVPVPAYLNYQPVAV